MTTFKSSMVGEEGIFDQHAEELMGLTGEPIHDDPLEIKIAELKAELRESVDDEETFQFAARAIENHLRQEREYLRERSRQIRQSVTS